jgi:hypothetical protein
VSGLQEEVKKAEKAYEVIAAKYASQVKATIDNEKKIGNSGTNRSSN